MAAESSSSAAVVERRKLVLLSSDGKRFPMSEAAGLLSGVIRSIIEDPEIRRVNNSVSFVSIKGATLSRIVEYCEQHAAVSAAAAAAAVSAAASSSDTGRIAAFAAESLRAFDEAFIGGVGMDLLYDLLTAANFMEIQGLLDLGCERVGELMKGKTPQQIRELFGIENDFTEEEEKKIRQENAWLFN